MKATVDVIVLVIAVRLTKNVKTFKTSEVSETSEVSSKSGGRYYFRIGSGDDFAEKVQVLKLAFHYAKRPWDSDRRA